MKNHWMIAFLSVLTLSATGCWQIQQPPQFIEKIVFKPSGDLQVAKVSMVFTDKIQSQLAGAFSLKDYGNLYTIPFAPELQQKFEVGFDLNLGVFKDQDYVKLNPVTLLPNGMPLNIPHPVVEVRASQPIHANFDLYGYVDTSQASWLGMAMLISYIDQVNFPAGLSINQVFLRDKDGNARVMANIFGPVLDDQGIVLRHGGLSLVANVRELLETMTERGDGASELVLYPTEAGTVAPIPAVAE